MIKENLHKGDKVYYTRIHQSLNLYELKELIIRTIEDNYFVGINKKDKHAYLLYYEDFDKTVYTDRLTAYENVIEAEKQKSKTEQEETYYEEY